MKLKNMFSMVKKENITNKTFSYSKANVTLSFTLRTDIKQDLKNFLELLKVAQEEIEDEINK